VGYYGVRSGNFSMAFQDNLLVPSLLNDPEERSSHLLRDVSLKSRINTNKLYLQDSV